MLFRSFVAAANEEFNRTRAEATAERDGNDARLSKIDKQIDSLVDAIANGARAASIQSKLEALEAEGRIRCIPTARAARLTMDREGIRRLAAETLGLPTSPYKFCDSLEELQAAIDGKIGYPCIVKPVMSSSGKGQSKIDGPADVKTAWDYAMAGGREIGRAHV